MEEHALGILNQIGVGNAIAFIVFIGGLVMTITTLYRSYMEKHDKEQVKNYERQHDYQELCDTVNTLSESFNNFNNEQRAHNERVDMQLSEITSELRKSEEDSMIEDDKLQKKLDNYIENNNRNQLATKKLNDKLNLMIESDKESIKSFIIVEYYKAVEKGYIEPHILETIETRYDMYLRENGNTYIKGLIDELRSLPKSFPKD